MGKMRHKEEIIKISVAPFIYYSSHLHKLMNKGLYIV